MTSSPDTTPDPHSAVPQVDESDAELTARIRSGPPGAGEAALDELYRRHRPPVFAYARTCARDPHTAEDLTSEAFVRVLRAVRGGGGPEEAWRPYLLTTVRRTAAAWSHSARHTQLCPDFETWLVTAPEGPLVRSGEEQMLHREDADLVLRAFHSLPERWQVVLWHSAVEGESAGTIAPLLGLSTSGVDSLIARAREGLRAAYLSEHVQGAAASDECRHFTALLAASVRRAGRTRRTHRGLKQHLSVCPGCRRASLELRELNSSLGVVLPASVLLWTGSSYGVKAASAAPAGTGAAAGGAASGGAAAGGAAPEGAASGTGAGPGAGGTAVATGITATAVKAGGIGVSVLALVVGGYTLLPTLPHGGNPPVPKPTLRVPHRVDG